MIAGLTFTTIFIEDSLRREAVKYKNQLHVIGVKEFYQQLRQDPEKTTLLYLYASWCGTCRWYMPSINTIAKEQPEVRVIAVSLDYSADDLIYYLHYKRPIYFTPFYIHPSEQKRFYKEMEKIHPNYDSSVPFIMVIKPKMKPIIIPPNIKNFFNAKKAIQNALQK